MGYWKIYKLLTIVIISFLILLNGVPLEVVCDVVAYCEANKNGNSDWVILPIANFDCYYGNTNFSKKWLSKMPDTILIREVSNGVSRVKVNI